MHNHFNDRFNVKLVLKLKWILNAKKWHCIGLCITQTYYNDSLLVYFYWVKLNVLYIIYAPNIVEYSLYLAVELSFKMMTLPDKY